MLQTVPACGSLQSWLLKASGVHEMGPRPKVLGGDKRWRERRQQFRKADN